MTCNIVNVCGEFIVIMVNSTHKDKVNEYSSGMRGEYQWNIVQEREITSLVRDGARLSVYAGGIISQIVNLNGVPN